MSHYSPIEVAKRKGQEDPIIMYLIVRKSLDMSIGKTAAQCAHAAQMLLLKYHEFFKMDVCPDVGMGLPPFSRETYDLFEAWLSGSFRKVVLKADEKQWEKIKNEIDCSKRALVIDAGLTELEPSTETIIGLCPMRKSNAPKLIKRLQVL